VKSKPFPQAVLITGAAGFIGRHLLETLRCLQPEIRLVALDRRPIHPLPEVEAHCLELSPKNREALKKVINGCGVEAVVHCAGSSFPHQEDLKRDHVESALGLLEVLASSKPGLIFCHIGSSAEYRPLPQPQKTREDTPTDPVGEYGRIKLAVTRTVLEYTRRGIIRGYVVRLFNPIGGGMPETQLVGRLCRLVQRRPTGPLTVGNLDTFRDYGDVRDMVRGIAVSLFQADRLTGRVLNLGSGCARSTRELVAGFLRRLPWPVDLQESEKEDSRRSPAVYWQEADISLAQALLGWSPRIPFSETLDDIARSIPFSFDEQSKT
jgi:nucleoside-diphosphate-sugar epimerase